MGKMNLLKANWTGKVGQTVGSKWKNKSVIRTYAIPSNPNTDAQQEVRAVFKIMTQTIALFSDQIKYLTALDVKGMSVKNAIMHLNKDLAKDTSLEPKDLQISKGGLQTPNGVTATYANASGDVTIGWTNPTATNFSSEALAVAVVVDVNDKAAVVKTAAYDATTMTASLGTGLTGPKVCYMYFLDKRGSAKIGSASVAVNVT